MIRTCLNMKYLSVISVLSMVLFIGTGLSMAQANGFFEEDSNSSINSLYPIPYDDFFFDEYNPHNFYNPNNRFNDTTAIDVTSTKEKLQSSEQLLEANMLFQDQGFYDSIERKSEQAMRKNTEKAIEDEFVEEERLSEQGSIKNAALSELTGSRLIVSARKKQYYEKLFPLLLANFEMTYNDKQRLKALFTYFSQGSLINAKDNIWLKRLARESFMIESMPEFNEQLGLLKP